MCVLSMSPVAEETFLKSGFPSLLLRLNINVKIESKNDFLNKKCPNKSFCISNAYQNDLFETLSEKGRGDGANSSA